MANIVIDSKYEPFSFDEKLKPYALYKEDYEKTLEEYEKILDLAGLLEYISNLFPDDPLVGRYKLYVDKLNKTADHMSKGMYMGHRKDLHDLRSMFNKEVSPMSNAYTSYMNDAERVQKLDDANPTSFHGDLPTSLDFYAKNPGYHTKVYSGNLLASLVATLLAPIANRITNDPSQAKQILGGQYYEIVKLYGNSPEFVMDLMNLVVNTYAQTGIVPEGANPEYFKMIDSVLESNGITRGNVSLDVLQTGYEYASQGLMSSVGLTSWETLGNRGYGAVPSGGSGGGKGDDDNPFDLSLPSTTDLAFNHTGKAVNGVILDDEGNFIDDFLNQGSGHGLLPFFNEDGTINFDFEGSDEVSRLSVDPIYNWIGKQVYGAARSGKLEKREKAIAEIVSTLLAAGYSDDEILKLKKEDIQKIYLEYNKAELGELSSDSYYYRQLNSEDTNNFLKLRTYDGKNIKLLKISGINSKLNSGELEYEYETSEKDIPLSKLEKQNITLYRSRTNGAIIAKIGENYYTFDSPVQDKARTIEFNDKLLSIKKLKLDYNNVIEALQSGKYKKGTQEYNNLIQEYYIILIELSKIENEANDIAFDDILTYGKPTKEE